MMSGGLMMVGEGKTVMQIGPGREPMNLSDITQNGLNVLEKQSMTTLLLLHGLIRWEQILSLEKKLKGCLI